MGTHRYAAFISYAHADEAHARRLHRALETYKLPKGMDEAARQNLTPIFRDKAELTAHHSLSEKIREAVRTSRYLIVLCSPAAKTSHWVNEEIKLFRKLHGEQSILCAIVEGTPEAAFPPALLDGGREPLAADLTGGKDGTRFGTTQLAASMLGVGLDNLVQRDVRRRRRRARLATISALAFSAIMGGTAFFAVQSRNKAQENRAQAEGLIEYMLTDLKANLEPVGRLDVLESVGDRVLQYYSDEDLAEMSDDRLARQARARHLIGQVALDGGKTDKALTQITGGRHPHQSRPHPKPGRHKRHFCPCAKCVLGGGIGEAHSKL